MKPSFHDMIHFFISDIHVKCQGLWQLSKYRPYNHRPGISPVFICQVGKPAVPGQRSPWIKLISGIWHLALPHVISNFLYIINPKILWISCISSQQNTGLSESITSASDLWPWRHLFLLISHHLISQSPPSSPASVVQQGCSHPMPLEIIWRHW